MPENVDNRLPFFALAAFMNVVSIEDAADDTLPLALVKAFIKP